MSPASASCCSMWLTDCRVQAGASSAMRLTKTLGNVSLGMSSGGGRKRGAQGGGRCSYWGGWVRFALCEQLVCQRVGGGAENSLAMTCQKLTRARGVVGAGGGGGGGGGFSAVGGGGRENPSGIP